MNLKIHLCLARLGRAQRAGDEAVASSSLSARSAWRSLVCEEDLLALLLSLSSAQSVLKPLTNNFKKVKLKSEINYMVKKKKAKSKKACPCCGCSPCKC
jgi:hypothetical protein